MTPEEVRSQIEEDLKWRLEEVAFFTAQLNRFSQVNSSDDEKRRVENDKSRFRKALVLMLYAHFEGFFRFSFTLYVNVLNEKQINVSQAIDVLVASSLYNVFGKYDDSKELVNQESDEVNKANKRLNNRINLIQELNKLYQEGKVVKLPISDKHDDSSSVIYTKSNLNFDVIEKVLYRLGFSTDILDLAIGGKKLKDVLNEFLGRRNTIAHGDGKFKEGINEREYNKFKEVFDRITKMISIIITRALSEKRYLKEEFRN